MSILSPITKFDNWFAGEDQSFLFPVEADTVGLSFVDITLWHLEFRMALGKGGASVLTKIATLEDPLNGVCRCHFLEADTITVAPRQYFYELWRTDNGFENVVAHGPVHLQARIES